jgi:SAM-dependent methyltransferase
MHSPAKSYRDQYYGIPYLSRVNVDGTPVLARMMQARLPDAGVVLDIGAGRGGAPLHPCKRSGITLIGVDSSEEVRLNKHLDRYFIQDAEVLPFEAATIDAVFSDFAFEHLRSPAKVLVEISRVLKPGGSLVFRTVNAFHYVAVCALILQGRMRATALKKSGRSPDEAFPTYYRINTRRSILRLLELNRFDLEEMICVEGPPEYLTFSKTLYRLGVLYERVANRSDRTRFLRANVIVAARKRLELRDA